MTHESIMLEGIVGSRAYGLDHPDSDTDKLGIWVAPLQQVVGLDLYNETTVTRDPDSTYHELKKFLILALKGNPTVLELLYLDSYTWMTDIGRNLVSSRDAFLSKGAIYESYRGYARSEFVKIQRKLDQLPDENLEKKLKKRAAHVLRLYLYGMQLLEEGEMSLDLSDARDDIFYAADLAVTDPKTFAKLILKWDLLLAETYQMSSLPDNPNRQLVNNFLIQTRYDYYAR